MYFDVKGKFTKGAGGASIQHGQSVTAGQTTGNSEKSPASEENSTHECQESEGSRFLTNENIHVYKQLINLK